MTKYLEQYGIVIPKINVAPDDAFIEMVGTITPDMSDEDIMALIDEIEADETARIELADHAMNEV